MGGFSNDVDELEVIEVMTESFGYKLEEPLIRLHCIDAQPHDEPAVGREPQALHSAREVMMEVALVCPSSQPLLIGELHVTRPPHETTWRLEKIVSGAKAWPHFKDLFPSPTWFEGVVDDLNVSRRVVSHMNPLPADDIKHVESGFTKMGEATAGESQ